jgi:hypothetical protein|tara:strand:- start:1297 stop:2037 length:741 start_codon:yes stop_codon:yes gene_type:complete
VIFELEEEPNVDDFMAGVYQSTGRQPKPPKTDVTLAGSMGQQPKGPSPAERAAERERMQKEFGMQYGHTYGGPEGGYPTSEYGDLITEESVYDEDAYGESPQIQPPKPSARQPNQEWSEGDLRSFAKKAVIPEGMKAAIPYSQDEWEMDLSPSDRLDLLNFVQRARGAGSGIVEIAQSIGNWLEKNREERRKRYREFGSVPTGYVKESQYRQMQADRDHLQKMLDEAGIETERLEREIATPYGQSE